MLDSKTRHLSTFPTTSSDRVSNVPYSWRWTRYWVRITPNYCWCVWDQGNCVIFQNIFFLKQREIGTSRIVSTSNWFFTRLEWGRSIYAPLRLNTPEQNLPRWGRQLDWMNIFFSLTSLSISIHHHNRTLQTNYRIKLLNIYLICHWRSWWLLFFLSIQIGRFSN